jgi:peptidoglycan/LPS O-acetylase OafA/YrhL
MAPFFLWFIVVDMLLIHMGTYDAKTLIKNALIIIVFFGALFSFYYLGEKSPGTAFILSLGLLLFFAGIMVSEMSRTGARDRDD